MQACLVGATAQVVVMAAYQFDQTSEYGQRLPELGFRPELELAEPSLVVVFRDASPVESPLQLVGSPQVHEPAAGTHDLCVAGRDWHRRYLDVAVDFVYLSGSAKPSPGFASRVLGDLPLFYSQQGTNLVWDSRTNSLWYAFVGCGEPSAVYSWNATTNATEQWSIPSNNLGNCQTVKAALGDDGMLWVMESSLLIRFDTRAHVGTSVEIASDMDMSPTAPTALALDGSGVLIARAKTAFLTRVDASLHVSAIPIPAELEGARDLAVADGVIYLLAGTTLDLLSPSGGVQGQARASGYGLTARPDGKVVLWQDAGKGVTIDGSGNPGESIVTPPSAGVGPTTDWHGHFWYVGSANRPVIVETTQGL